MISTKNHQNCDEFYPLTMLTKNRQEQFRDGLFHEFQFSHINKKRKNKL